ncbi:PREDICTED: uncharacterized protein LOC109233763 [Nicotiana attenuata]|uniref:uncharacterized protein LOC109233763 n=1 Tax=Nicotiana attenuata TaxID=49451 RepID=UPI000905762E|nr:PREDICTED: uncharacterized protein LOC109233763 [Nicotiana attenuata]
MKLIWSPETASKAYLDTLQTCGISRKSSGAEFLSAMAGGYNAKLTVEAWKSGDSITTSISLAIAAKHSHGRYVCVVPDESSRLEYVGAMQNSGTSLPEMMVGEAEEVMERLNGIDFLIVDEGRKDFTRVFKSAKLGHRGAILVSKNGSKSKIESSTSTFSWDGVLDRKVCVVRSVTLPFGNGLEIAYIASKDGNKKTRKYVKRWIRHVDRNSGEEHVIRR